MKPANAVLFFFVSVGPSVANAQFGSGGMDQSVSDWVLDPAAVEAIARGAEPMGKNVRWLTLNEKRIKVERTNELTDAKREQNKLQREELGKLAQGFTQTLNLFESYYEKYKIVASAVKTLSETREFARRIAGFINAVDYVYREAQLLDLLEPEELQMIERYLDGMISTAEHIVEKGSILLLDKDSQSNELDRLREEHGEFFVLMRSVDRTEQLNALNRDVAVLSSDLQRLAAHISSTIKNRSYDPANSDAMHRLFDRN